MPALILYDLPSCGRCACWSLNPWKTRLALNYKAVDYETAWLEYPDVAPTLKAAGLPPADGDTAEYTIPTVRLPSGEYVMDSAKIARQLEKLYPEPSLHLDSDVVQQLEQMFMAAVLPLAAVFMPRIPRRLLNEESKGYFYSTREKRFGMSLDQFEKEKGGEPAWAAVKEPLEKVAALLNKQAGPYFLGTTVSYADFVLVSYLHFAKLVGDDVYDRIVAHDKAFDDVYKACSKWLERDDH